MPLKFGTKGKDLLTSLSLVDTGASLSLVSLELYEKLRKLGHATELETRNECVRGIGSGGMDSLGTTRLTFILKDHNRSRKSAKKFVTRKIEYEVRVAKGPGQCASARK